MISLFALILGFLLDLCFGDPHWMPHPIRLIGWLIQKLERLLRRLFPQARRAGNGFNIIAEHGKAKIVRRENGQHAQSSLRADSVHRQQEAEYFQVIPA